VHGNRLCATLLLTVGPSEMSAHTALRALRYPSCRAVLCVFLAASVGCGPNRSEWMNSAAQEQAKIGTETIGDADGVRRQAGEAATVLTRLSAPWASNPPKGQQAAALQFVQDSAEISSGLRAIADSKGDAQFTSAVFGMCDPVRRQAAPRVGLVMIALAGNIQTHPPANMSEEDQQQAFNYFSTFGQRMVGVPTKCDQVAEAMAEASAEEQKAEVEHSQNVSTAVNAAALVFAGTVLFATAVGAAAATRPPVQNTYYYGNPTVQ
jgi:hypothetical protein